MRRATLLTAATLLLAFLAGGPAAAAVVAASVRDAAGAAVKDAVVLARPVGAMPALQPANDNVDQIDKEFVPYVKVVMAGSAVSFPNKDNIRHQVYSFSPAKRFELPLYVGTPATPVVFDKPGVVTLGCNIHDWMAAYVYVSDTPYYAITQADGTARLAGLPPGDYVLQVWHPRMDGAESATAQRIRIDSDAKAAWTVKLKPDLRPRRAPAAHGGGYR
jgi:plastocyanin